MKAKGVVVYNNDGMEEIKILQARVEELEVGMDACAQQYSRDQIRIMELALRTKAAEAKVAASTSKERDMGAITWQGNIALHEGCVLSVHHHKAEWFYAACRPVAAQSRMDGPYITDKSAKGAAEAVALGWLEVGDK